MRRSKLLARLRNKEAARICSLGHFIPSFVRQAAHFGFDAVWLDLEHRAFGTRELQALLAFFHRYDIDCLLRTPTLEKTGLYRHLEDGASGLMIPFVSTAEKTRTLVNAVKFPPVGERGKDGVGLDCDFLFPDDDYTDNANRETFLTVQIETPEAVDNVEEIAAVSGIDGLFVGPGDLGLRLQKQPTSWTLETAIERVAATAAKHGVAWGMPVGNVEDLKRRHEQGARLLAYGNEFIALMEMLKSSAASFDSVLGDRKEV